MRLRPHLQSPRAPLRLRLVSRRAVGRSRPRGGGARRAPRARAVARAMGAAAARAHVRGVAIGVGAAVASATAAIAVAVTRSRALVRARARGPPGNARIGNASALLYTFVNQLTTEAPSRATHSGSLFRFFRMRALFAGSLAASPSRVAAARALAATRAVTSN